MAIKDATKMVTRVEEGTKLNAKEKRLASVMVNTKSNLARNMAAEFLKTRGDIANSKTNENEAKIAVIQDNLEKKKVEEHRIRKALEYQQDEDILLPRGHIKRQHPTSLNSPQLLITPKSVKSSRHRGHIGRNKTNHNHQRNLRKRKNKKSNIDQIIISKFHSI